MGGWGDFFKNPLATFAKQMKPPREVVGYLERWGEVAQAGSWAAPMIGGAMMGGEMGMLQAWGGMGGGAAGAPPPAYMDFQYLPQTSTQPQPSSGGSGVAVGVGVFALIALVGGVALVTMKKS